MLYSKKIDFHTHSIHSFDGNHTCKDICECAINNNVKYLAITDHCEIDSKDLNFEEFCKNQFADVANMKKEFYPKLNVYNGIELGQAIYNKPLAEKILSDYDYDFVLGSIHNLENMEDFYYLDYTKFNVTELLTRYFDALIELCEWGNFDSLAHLTYPLRYIYGNYKINVDLCKFSDKIENILKILVKKEKALEINTSGLGMEIHDFLPSVEVIKQFKKLGGKYITIGSDSHYKEKMGNFVNEGLDAIKECGFEFVTIYEKRQPKLIKIDDLV